MWMKTVTLEFTHRLNFPYNQVLSLVQDANSMLRLNPEVVDVNSSPDELGIWKVAAKLVKFFGLVIHYNVKYTLKEDGFFATSQAGFSTQTESRWIVTQDSVTKAKEQFQLTAVWFMMPFILKTVNHVHGDNMTIALSKELTKRDQAS